MSTPQKYAPTEQEIQLKRLQLRPTETRGRSLPPRATRGVPPHLYGSWEFNSPEPTSSLQVSSMERKPDHFETLKERIKKLRRASRHEVPTSSEEEDDGGRLPNAEQQEESLIQFDDPPPPNSSFIDQNQLSQTNPFKFDFDDPAFHSTPAANAQPHLTPPPPESEIQPDPFQHYVETPAAARSSTSKRQPNQSPDQTYQPLNTGNFGVPPRQPENYYPIPGNTFETVPKPSGENQFFPPPPPPLFPMPNYGAATQKPPQSSAPLVKNKLSQNVPAQTPKHKQRYPPPRQLWNLTSQPPQYNYGTSQPQQQPRMNNPQSYQQSQQYFPAPPQQQQASINSMVSQLVSQQHAQTKCLVHRQSTSSKLPSFGGNPLDWPLFYHRYMQTTADCMYSPSENVTRLGEALRGDAKRHVQPLLIMPNSNPDDIIARLHQRFGRPQYIVEALVDTVRKLPTPKQNKLNSILDFSSAINNLVMTIKSLQVDVHLHNPQLIKELVEKLPDNLKLHWGTRAMCLVTPSLEDFSYWMEGIASAASYVTTPDFRSDEGKSKRGGESTFTATSSSHSPKPQKFDATPPSNQCHYCKKTGLRIAACSEFAKSDVDERWTKVKELKLCFRCLQPKCNVYVCRSRRLCSVEGCNRRHHSLLHGSKVNSKPEFQPSPTKEPVKQVNGHVNGNNSTTVILRVLPVTLYGPGGEVTVNALLDEASTVTMLCEKTAKDLQLGGQLDPLRLNWTNGTTQADNASRRVKCHVGPVKSKVKFRMEGVRTVRNLDLPAQSVDYQKVVSSHPHLKGVTLQVMPEAKPVILIGQPHIQLTLARSVKEGEETAPVATETKLGWVLHGPTGGSSTTHHAFSCFHESDSDIIHRLVKESFNLESIGVKTYASSRSKEDIEAEKKMEKLTRRVGDRWETGLLWRKEPTADNNSPEIRQHKIDLPHCTATGSPARFASTTLSGGVTCSRVPLGEGLYALPSLPSEYRFPTTSPGISMLPPTYAMAYRRLLGVEKRLKKNEDLRVEFNNKIQHYLDKGYARKLSPAEATKPTPKQWFLPIFPVFNPNKPGKLRLVFDAASQSYGKSLNDFLLTGPDLLVSLPGLLLTFRQKNVGFSGDITEMFHQVLIHPEDQPAQRFLWRENEDSPPDVYQLQVMMFGAVCSPFCAQFVKNNNAEEFASQFPAAVRAIKKKHYMDDYIDSADTEKEAISLIKEVTEVHGKGGFHIGKWISNSTAVLESIQPDDRVAAAKDLSCWSEIPTERALGLHWNPREDCFQFKLNLDRAGEGIATGEKIPTKRAILRLIMLVWDPLGFLSNYMIKARILLQQLWRSQLGWDDEIPHEAYKKWRSWVKKLKEVEKIRIPRCYYTHLSSCEDIQLHIFADASEVAYCTVAYLRISTPTEVTTTFVMSKSRVSPLKPASIPRLELQAALMAARLGKFIVESLEVPIQSVTHWTDSATVLKWIRSEARRFQQFISNRIGEIHECSDISSWRWVPSKSNVADDATRERKCNISNDNRWWTGPEFLKMNPAEWPEEDESCCPDEDTLELRKDFVAVVIEMPTFDYLPNIFRFSNYLRLVRATAYVLSACNRFRGNAVSKLSVIKAEMMLIRRCQWEQYAAEMQILRNGEEIPKSSSIYKLSPVLDHDGVLRMKSRLHSAEQEGIRMPIILPPKRQLTRLLILYQHKINMHQGEEFVRNEIRQRFWIPHSRTAIRSAIRQCWECRVKNVKARAPFMGNLPHFRFQPQPRPFTLVGMDYFGPFHITVKRSVVKVYGVIFTCLTVRAVHLEIASDLTTDACIMAIRRMIARRGQPTKMWSDNGTNLRGAEKELRESIQQLNPDEISEKMQAKGIEWSFIPPSSPHFGATWERLVRSVKTSLYVVLKNRAPKEEVLRTLMTEVEAIVNSRPLTGVPSDPDAPEALTPFHFILGTSSTLQPLGSFDEKDLILSKRWRQAQALAESFWRRWVREYVPTLQQRTKWHEKSPNLRVGDMVVVFDESLKRGSYPLGLIISTKPGKDGVVRVAEVKTSTGIYTRPVVKLGKIGLNSGDEQRWNFGKIEGKDVDGEIETVEQREPSQAVEEKCGDNEDC